MYSYGAKGMPVFVPNSSLAAPIALATTRNATDFHGPSVRQYSASVTSGSNAMYVHVGAATSVW